MSSFLQDYHLPGVIIAYIIGYQIAIYFLYLYYKSKDENLALNKILLAYGLVYGLGFTGVLIRTINSYYFTDSVSSDFFTILSHILIATAAITFQLILSSESFNEIISTNITKIVLIFTIIVSILLVFIKVVIIIAPLLLIAIGVGAIYMLIFHYRLIKRSTGDIKKRLIIITIGNILMITAIIIGSQETVIYLPQDIQEPFLIMLIPVLVIGLGIIFLGVYEFPAFLEFDWKENLIKLYIISQKEYKELYSFDFREEIEEKSIDQTNIEKVFSKGIIGIEDIISTITKTKDKKIRKIKQGELLIILEHGDKPDYFITYVLLINKEMNSINYFLKNVKSKFQNLYKNILINLEFIKGNEKEIFSSFDIKLKKLLM